MKKLSVLFLMLALSGLSSFANESYDEAVPAGTPTTQIDEWDTEEDLPIDQDGTFSTTDED